MDAALISALAAVGGSLVGAMAPVLSNYVIQRSLNRREMLNHQLIQREAIYESFIKTAARLYAQSMTENLKTMDEIVGLYTIVSQLRLMASEPVLQAAVALVQTVTKQYAEPNLTIDQIQASALSRKVDPLGEFSSACRLELFDILNGTSKLAKITQSRPSQ